ncbi:MAG: cytochrome c [Phycisphaerae bacterium]|nr:cytochrome c [Phycisphaerae bacterium]
MISTRFNRFFAIGVFGALFLIISALLIGTMPVRVRAQPSTVPSVTFAHDVAPILYANCASCHRAGEAGPFPLMSYDDAKKHADIIAAVVKTRQMPPWKAESGYGHFLNERHLTDDQIATLAAWNAAGAPEGDPSQTPPAPSFPEGGWQLGKPDLVVQMSESFTVPASGRDVFRCFVVPLNLETDEYVTAAEFRPSNRKVVHHSLLFLDSRGQARGVQAKWTADHPDDHQIGYDHFGGPGFTPSGGLGGWAPGAMPSFLPDGIARFLAAGSDLVIQTHFHPTGKTEVEQSSIGIYFAKKPPARVLSQLLLGNRHLDIPAGDKSYVATDALVLPCDVSVVGITPHAHLICKQMDVWATLPGTSSPTTQAATKPDESESAGVPLIRIGDWDFNWQGLYRYATPLRLPKGATLHMRYVYDNSADNERNPNSPPAEIRFGEQTINEMAFCFLEVVPERAMDQLALRRARIQHLLSLR